MNTVKSSQNLRLKELLSNHIVVGIDIDWVLVDTVEACIRKAYSWFQIVMSYDDWHHWNPHENPQLQDVGVSRQEDTVTFFHDIVHNPDWQIPPISGAPGWVDALKQAWKILIALTGRADDARGVTTDLLDNHYSGKFDDVLFSNHDVPESKKPKSQVAKENGITFMIEDNIHYAIELASNGIPLILLTQPWNRDAIIPEGLLIFRVASWAEIQEALI